MRLKFEMCKNWREKGICKYGDKCLFAHGDKELTKRTVEKTPAASEVLKRDDLTSKTEERVRRQNSLAPEWSNDKNDDCQDLGKDDFDHQE